MSEIPPPPPPFQPEGSFAQDPYGPAPQKKKNNTLLIVLAIIGGSLMCCCAGVGIFSYSVMKKGMGTVSCAMTVQILGESFRDYAKDHDGKLPPEKGWEKAVQPYFAKQMKGTPTNSPMAFPSAQGPWGCDHEGQKTGMTYNSDVAGKKLDDLKSSDIILFESPETGSNLARKYQEPKEPSPKMMGLPIGWYYYTVDGRMGNTGASEQFKNGFPQEKMPESKK